ncbi:NAD(P)-dependent dehydrogenase (short-subunit alcohol dehydrogenase family) [Haloactinospora alba]|uniref:NAD(P)-dependent dehydrogenase (Short-subunit alcohol dehydrogenase family) n=1 Tax=Haloactinospora alba TaxID=405555 RepID=A0A543N952_9ACTN|nr:SDR family oxidoreductase [Haloactinospora alba]TQN28364.1 NAD(P)-dependent dehydrogenase (short-subunit alcohol dehydrogenase family) [Haloactinospora alba]
MRLDGRTAMVTGAARSLGRAHALLFAREGADLLLVDRCATEGPYPLAGRKELEETAEECRRHGSRVVTAVADVRDREAVDDAVRTGVDTFGRIDALVNNAGLLAPGGVPSHELSEDEWNLVIDVNLNGTWRCCRAVLPHMAAQRFGTIVNTASTGGRVAFELYSNYVAAKHAVVGLTKALALEYGRSGIRVNAVSPSTVAVGDGTDAVSTTAVARSLGSSLAEYERASSTQHATGRLVTAEEVAAACLWLTSTESGGTTGTDLLVDGGFTAR